jgi:hypothetical protein
MHQSCLAASILSRHGLTDRNCHSGGTCPLHHRNITSRDRTSTLAGRWPLAGDPVLAGAIQVGIVKQVVTLGNYQY